MFNKGDYLICVNNSYAASLSIYRLYEVWDCGYDSNEYLGEDLFVWLSEDEFENKAGWYASRFRLATEEEIKVYMQAE